jgi:hypothetical protein
MDKANRVNYCWVAVIMTLILSLAWFFVGVEQVSGEFKEETESPTKNHARDNINVIMTATQQ